MPKLTRTPTFLRLPAETADTLQAVSAVLNRSQSDLVAEALDHHLDQEIRRRRIGRLVKSLKAERAKR